MRKFKPLMALAGLVVVLAACSSSAASPGPTAGNATPDAAGATVDPTSMRFVTVVKLIGVGWFDRQEAGIKEFAALTGINATMTGADDASPEKQVKIIQDLIPTKPTAILPVPNSPEALESVLKQAMDAGIVVVSHEGKTQKNQDADIDAFDATAYGAHMMDKLADCMGKQGKYIAFVGHLTDPSHTGWAQGALDQATAQYADIQRIGDPIESLEDVNVAYEKTKELLTKYPDIKGFEGSSAIDVVGIGRAIQEAGLQDKTCVMGTSIPSLATKFLADNSIDMIFFWDPAIAGKAQNTLAQMIVNGVNIEPGLNLHLTGYENLQPVKGFPKAFHGNAWVDVDMTNASQYPF